MTDVTANLAGAAAPDTTAAAAAYDPNAKQKAQAQPLPTLAVLLPIALSLSLAFTLTDVAPLVLRVMFGEDFMRAQHILTILMWAYPLMTVNAVITHWLIARGRERLNAVLVFSHLIAHAAGLAYLLPRYGAEGAALALGGAEVILCAGTCMALLRLHD